jgi:cytochrome c-type biogenesis protein CcmH
MKRAAAIVHAVLFAAALLSAGPVRAAYDQPLPDAAQETRARALQKELRCLVCQGESLDESNAQLAADLRALIRQRIAQGESDQQIKDYLVSRYGDFILMKPPLRGDTFLLWFAPGLVLLLGAGVVVLTIRRAKARSAEEETEVL